MGKHPQIVSLRTSETIDCEAADWLAKLDSGKLSVDDRRALKEWLSLDPRHGQALKSLTSIWCEMDILLNDFPGADTVDDTGMFSFFSMKKLASPVLVAICFGVITLSVWMMLPIKKDDAVETYFLTTSVGTQQVEQFSDGSSAHLNTDSIIETEYTDSTRIVRLLRGEALFDVAHDPERPFIVYVGNNQVRAIGTKFIVRLTSENIVVTVTDGKVQLSKRTSGGGRPFDTDDKVTLEQEVIVVSQGEEVEFNDKTKEPKLKEVENEELGRRLSWLNGQLIFKNETLEYVVDEISRYVPTRIIIDEPELRDVRISGRFEIGDTDALLEAIEVSFNVRVSYVNEDLIHLSR